MFLNEGELHCKVAKQFLNESKLRLQTHYDEKYHKKPKLVVYHSMKIENNEKWPKIKKQK